jgi:hypothetical protein
MNQPTQLTLAGLSGLALLTFTTSALAEQGELQAGVATPILLYNKATTETKVGGATAKSKGSGTTWGIGNSVLGEVGYGVTPNLVVGGLFQLSGASDNEDGGGGDASTFSLLLGPKLDYMFLPGDKVQPFVGAVVGLSHASTSLGNSAESVETGFQLMGRLGIRAFPNSTFSFDPQLVFGQRWASGETTAMDTKFDTSASVFQIGVLLGISGWI